MRGKLIVIEGIDGCGKSTQTRMLTEKFEKEGLKCKYIHFPMLEQGIYGKLIAQFLRGELGHPDIIDLDYDIHPKLVALMYACERKEHSATIQKWLGEGYMVIADRYVYSNIAYQCTKFFYLWEKNRLQDWILDLEFNTNKLPRPDKTLFLDLPKKYIASKMLDERCGDDRDYTHGKKDIYEANASFQSDVYDEYMRLVNAMDDFVAVKCYGENGICSIEEIHERICKEIV